MSNVYIHWCDSILLCFCYHDKILWPEARVCLAYSSKEGVCVVRTAWGEYQSRAGESLFLCTQKTESANTE